MPRQNIKNWGGLLLDEKDYTDENQELLKKWKVKENQLWSIGPHRLLVKSSESKEARKLFGKVEGVCTDPPYDMESKKVSDIILRYTDVAVVLCNDKMAFELGTIWQMRLDFIWVHRHPRSFNSDNQPVFYHAHVIVIASTKKVKTMWRRPTLDFGSVWHIDGRTTNSYGKPPELFEAMLHGFKWKKFVDPFVGVGTSFIAAERQGKICYGCEIDLPSVAVALERCEKFGLDKPRLIK